MDKSTNYVIARRSPRYFYRDFYFLLITGIFLFTSVISNGSLWGFIDSSESPLILQWAIVIIPHFLAFGGAYMQFYKVQPGITISTVGTFLLIFIPHYSPPLAGYIIVCFQAWYISAYIYSHRKLWFSILGCGSLLGIGVYWYKAAYPYYVRGGARFWEYITWDEFYALIFFLILGGASIVACALWGRRTLLREERLKNLEAKLEVATLTERNRIAREMHDIIAHSLTAIIAQADGGRYAGAKDPAQSLLVLERIGQIGRDSLEQMRELLSVLRTDDTRSADGNPGLNSIPVLLAQGERDGLSIERHIYGEPASLEESKELIIFRFYQESLTNVLKYAGRTMVQIEEHWDREKQELAITVDNMPGKGLISHEHFSSSAGQGLIGIKERARFLGGKASWGESLIYPQGWRVEMRIPWGKSSSQFVSMEDKGEYNEEKKG